MEGIEGEVLACVEAMPDQDTEEQPVEVDLSGLKIDDDVVIGKGLTSRGTVAATDDEAGTITVRLENPIAGRDFLEAPRDRVFRL
ncbi:MAG TPA: hypothetical protein VIC06_05625 [Solirubrobacteraceae bacterium]